MTTIAIVGARGFVGRTLAHAFASSGFEVTAVTRELYAQAQQATYDVLVNAAMPAARFWAKSNPSADVLETVVKTSDLYYGWRYKKFVQISSVSARCQLDTVYGRHKAAAERICDTGNTLILRLGPMYGEGLAKGVLIDIINERAVFAAGESRYAFAPVSLAGSWLTKNLQRTGIVEVGARDSIRLDEIAAHINARVEFKGNADHQETVAPEPNFPEARGVLTFIDQLRKEANI